MTIKNLLIQFKHIHKRKIQGIEFDPAKYDNILNQFKEYLAGSRSMFEVTSVYYYGNHLSLSRFAHFFDLPIQFVRACYEEFGGDIDKYFYYSGRDYIEHNSRYMDKEEFGNRHRIPWHLVNPIEHVNYGLFLDVISAYVRENPCKFGNLGDMTLHSYTEEFAKGSEGHGRTTQVPRVKTLENIIKKLSPEKKTKVRIHLDEHDPEPLSKAQV